MPTEKLKDLMESLDLFAEEAYVDIMRNKIDPDHLGILATCVITHFS